MSSLIAKMAPYLKQGIGATVALSGLQRVDPKIKRFIEGSVVAGYGADNIIEFLRNQTVSEGKRAGESRLQERTAQGTARPDEMATNETFSQGRKGRDLAGQAAGVAGGIGGLLASISGGGGQQPITPEVLGPEQQQLAPEQLGVPQEQRQLPAPNQQLGVQPEQQQPAPESPIAPTVEAVESPPKPQSDEEIEKASIVKALKKAGLDTVIMRMDADNEDIQKISSYITDVYPPTAITLEKNLGRPLLESISIFLGKKTKKSKPAKSEKAQPNTDQAGGNPQLLESMRALNNAINQMRGR